MLRAFLVESQCLRGERKGPRPPIRHFAPTTNPSLCPAFPRRIPPRFHRESRAFVARGCLKTLRRAQPILSRAKHFCSPTGKKTLPMRSIGHGGSTVTAAAAFSARNASGLARPSSCYRKIGPKCVKTCTTGQALQQNRPGMRQGLQDRAGATAKKAQNASGLARLSSCYRKIAPKCVRTCTTEQAVIS